MRFIFHHNISLIRLIHRSCLIQQSVAPYRSQYCLDNLYPNSLSSTAKSQQQKVENSDVFSGHIPIDELEITHSRSSGPGGQNVNKVNSKVEIRFNVEKAKWIPESLKSKLLLAEASSITKHGYLVIKSEKTRSQTLNQADCLDRIRTMIRECDVKPYVPTEEDLELIRQRQNKARAAMLREKKSHSLTKQSRQSPSSSDV